MTAFRRTTGRVALTGYRWASRGRAHAFAALCGGAFAAFGPHSVLMPPVRIEGERWIAIGAEVFVGPGALLQALSEPEPGRLEIGDGTKITGACVLSAAVDVTIGRRVLIARNVYVADHRHAFSDPARPVLDQGVEQLAPVRVGDGAWLGQNVVVGPGVHIGAGAVVGANSVVLDDVPAHATAVGAPARVLGLRRRAA